jgi:glycosyltransferase involved in cell wall biosynthesis
MQKEFEKFSDWGGCPDRSAVEQEERQWKETASLADLLVCPSEWVADGVRALTPDASKKIRVVPYGCSINFDGRTNQPEPGRILFAGGYPLRKGLHYLAQAATRLKGAGINVDVRVAGMIPSGVADHPICKDLHFLGKLNAEQMKTEYLSADCFVLPALSEGFASVVAEAISAGCPVVVTKQTGSPIIHEREGLIVASCDSTALAGAIRRMVEDRGLRDRCAAHCLEQRSFYSEDQWCRRWIAALP